jgi:CubicO group peptidase (beta-lactamase class C family)
MIHLNTQEHTCGRLTDLGPTRCFPPATHVRWLCVVAALLVLAVAGSAQDLQRMAEAVKAQTGNRPFMGSVLVATRDEVVFQASAGLANVEWNVPNSAKTKFRIGSLTKQFTAVAILLLQERGKLQLEHPVENYIDGVPEFWRGITIRQLLTHSAGVPDTLALPNKDNREWELRGFTPAILFERMRSLPLDFKPGTHFNYSNTGYMLLGWIVERVSGQTYREFIKQNLLDPIGMAESGYDSGVAVIPQRASGYEAGALGNSLRNANYIDMRAPGAAGGLYSTTGDLLKWTRALFGGKVLQSSSLDQMITPAKSGYAFGLRIGAKNGRKRYSHSGAINGFGSFLAYFPASDVTIAVLSNVAGPSAAELEERLETIYFGE